jgi:hypothetical protein
VTCGSKLGVTLYDTFLFVSYDNGINWTDIRDNLPVPSWPLLQIVEINYDRLFAGPNESGLWYRDALLTGVKKIAKEKSNILRVAPNPAESSITAFIDLAEEANGKIIISDITGRFVFDSGLLNFNSGTNQHAINIENFNPGIFIMSLLVDGKRYHQKFIKSGK